MAKVSIVKWSQKLIFVAWSVISGIPKYFKNCRFQCNFNRYFCHITIIKWSQNCQNFTRKVFFLNIEYWGLFPIDIPILAFKTYHHPLNSTHRSKSGVFGIAWVLVIIWEHVEHPGLTRSKIRITLTRGRWTLCTSPWTSDAPHQFSDAKKLHGKGTHKQTNRRTLRLYERIGQGADSLKITKVC